MRKFVLYIFATGVLILTGGCQNDGQKKTESSVSSDEALDFGRRIFGEKVTIAIRGDLNSNGKRDALAVVMIKQLDEMKFWIQKGGVVEKYDDGWKVVLRIDERVFNAIGPLNDIPESRNGYILSFSMVQNPVMLKVSAADAKGQPASEEFMFKWDEMNGKYDVQKK